MMSGDYIDRYAVLNTIDDAIAHNALSYEGCVNEIIESIAKIPADDMRPVVRGKWEDVEVTYVADKTTLPFERISSMRCDQCNRYHTEIYYYGNPTEMAHFCPNCGADMRETDYA